MENNMENNIIKYTDFLTENKEIEYIELFQKHLDKTLDSFFNDNLNDLPLDIHINNENIRFYLNADTWEIFENFIQNIKLADDEYEKFDKKRKIIKDFNV